MSGEKNKKEEILEMQLQFLTIFLQTGPCLLQNDFMDFEGCY